MTVFFTKRFRNKKAISHRNPIRITKNKLIHKNGSRKPLSL